MGDPRQRLTPPGGSGPLSFPASPFQLLSAPDAFEEGEETPAKKEGRKVPHRGAAMDVLR